MLTILTSSQTAGTPFETDWAGRHYILVDGLTSQTLRLQYEAHDRASWVNADTQGDDASTFTSNGGTVVFVQPGVRWRILSSAAGATVRISAIENAHTAAGGGLRHVT